MKNTSRGGEIKPDNTKQQQISMQPFYSTAEEIETIAEAFNAKTLPKYQWTHAAHLTVAVWHLKHYGFDEAVTRIRKGITEYNVAVGTPNTTTGGYHETMTVFWMTVTDFFMRSNKALRLCDACNALLTGPLAARELPFYFYERSIILSPAARAAFVQPDKNELTDTALATILKAGTLM